MALRYNAGVLEHRRNGVVYPRHLKKQAFIATTPNSREGKRSKKKERLEELNPEALSSMRDTPEQPAYC